MRAEVYKRIVDSYAAFLIVGGGVILFGILAYGVYCMLRDFLVLFFVIFGTYLLAWIVVLVRVVVMTMRLSDGETEKKE